jgi:hypothetical protein
MIQMMSGIDNSERVKYSISIELEIPSYESVRYLPDSVVIRLDKKKEQTEEKGIQKHSEQLVKIDQEVQKGGSLESDRKLKLFVDIFNALAGENRDDVKRETLIDELVITSKFTGEEAAIYLKKAQKYGFIFERKTNVYALA